MSDCVEGIYSFMKAKREAQQPFAVVFILKSVKLLFELVGNNMFKMTAWLQLEVLDAYYSCLFYNQNS